MKTPISWPELWIHIAREVAKRSKDPSTQVGAVLVSPDNRRIFIGYNGFPRKILDLQNRWHDKKVKYATVIHAEVNALANRNCDVHGWTCYVTVKPCERCAVELIQSGITRVVYEHEHPAIDYTWADTLFAEAQVDLVNIMDFIGKDK